MKLIRFFIILTLGVCVGMSNVSNLHAFDAPNIPHQPPSGLKGDEPGAETTMEDGNKTITQTTTEPTPPPDTEITVSKVRKENKDGSTRDEVTTTVEVTEKGKGKDGRPIKKTKTRTTTTTVREKDAKGNLNTTTTVRISTTTFSKPDYDGVQQPTAIEAKPVQTHTTDQEGTETTEWTNRDGNKITVKKYKDGRESKKTTYKDTGKYDKTCIYPDGRKIEITGKPNGVEYWDYYGKDKKFIKRETRVDGKVIKTSPDKPEDLDDEDFDDIGMLNWPGTEGVVCRFIPSGRNYGCIGDLVITNTTDEPVSVTVPPGLLLESSDPAVQDLYAADTPTVSPCLGAQEFNKPMTIDPGATYVVEHLPGFCPDFEKDPPSKDASDVYVAKQPDEKAQILLDTIASVNAVDIDSMDLQVFEQDKARQMMAQGALWMVDSRIDEVEGNVVTATALTDHYWEAFETAAHEQLDQMSQEQRTEAEDLVKEDLKAMVSATSFVAKGITETVKGIEDEVNTR